MASEVNANFIALANGIEEGKTFTTNAINDFNIEIESKLDVAIGDKINRNFSNSVNISNCLLEVPQRINVEIVDGTVVLRTGSVVTVPNGTGVFDYVTVDSDITMGPVGSYTGDCVLFVSATGKTLVQYIVSETTSGTTAPTGNGGWFDIANNLVKGYQAGSDLGVRLSLPVAIIHRTSGVWDSIQQTFNSMGYIGTTVWVDKGVKGLIPNGRNADGSLKNIELSIDSIKLRTSSETGNFTGFIASNGNLGNTTVIKYDSVRNVMYNSLTGEILYVMHYAVFNRTSGVVSEFEPFQIFHAVNYSEYRNGVGSSVAYVVETYSNGTSWYRVWSNGWIEQGGYSGNSTGEKTITLHKAFTSGNYHIQLTYGGTARNANGMSMDEMQAYSKNTTSFKIYDDQVIGKYWYAYGY